jgi:hypothetical protein
VHVVLRRPAAGDAAAGEDVADLADRHHLEARPLHRVEHRGRGGRDGEVLAVTRPAPEGAGLAGEGAGDHARDEVLALQQFARRGAPGVERLERHLLDVRGDLEDAVGAGVDDRPAGLEVLLP